MRNGLVVAAWGVVLAGVWTAAIAAQPFGQDTAVNDIRLEEARKEAGRLVYSDVFRDSIREVRGVGVHLGMRSVAQKPFMRGEQLVFEVGWGPLRAGYGIVTLSADPAAGKFAVTAEAMTNNFFSAIYKVRDLLYCEGDLRGLYPLFFEEHLREGRFCADRWILFDHVNKRAFTHRSDTAGIETPRFSQSVVTLLYYLRSVPLKSSFSVDAFVQGKSYDVAFRVRKKERIKTDWGVFDCNVVEPVLVGKGRVFTSRDKVRIWLTDDENALPLLMKTKIAVGSLSARLIRHEIRRG